MLAPNVEQILTRLSATESTTELQSFWLDSYTQLIDNKLFIISDQSIKMLQEASISKPVTPLGSLVLMNHLVDGRIDENLIQNSIETAVRLLDGMLDITSLTADAKKIVNQYRKIALSVEDFDGYIATKLEASTSQEIDYIGNLISNGSYRASESLAEEKGVCQNWEEIKQSIQPRVFEYWYNTESGEILSGLEISQNYDNQSVLQTQYEIVPRRNSHILAYPAESQWQAWSDRDLSAKKIIDTNNTVFGSDKKDIQPTFIPIEDVLLGLNNSPVEPEVEFEIPNDNFENSETLIPVKNLTAEIPVPELFEEEDDLNFDEIQEILESVDEGNQGLFQIGELVKINNPAKPNFGKTMQVVNIETDEASTSPIYILSDGGQGVESRWMEVELVAADLSQLLSKVNIPHVEPKEVEEVEPVTKKNIPINTINNNNMPQYTLQLTQNLSTKSFGDLKLSFQYDASGLKIINVFAKGLKDDDYFILQKFVTLLNLAITSGVKTEQLSAVLTDSNDQISFNELIQAVAQALSTSPNQIQDLNPELLGKL